jgi:IS5 family transposase
MAKNQGQLYSLFGLANLVIAKRSLMGRQARGAS